MDRILITGVSSGIGRALTKRLIADGQTVWGIARRQNLSKIFDINKFRVIKTFDVKNTYPLLYWLRISPLPKILKLSISTILKILRIDKIPLSLRVGNIGVIARK